MLEVNFIRENKDTVIKGLKIKKHANPEEDVNSILDFDTRRKETQQLLDNTLSESKKAAQQIGMLIKSGETEKAEKAKLAVGELRKKQKELKEELNTVESDLMDLLLKVPNVPNKIVPPGNSDEDNVEISTNYFDVELNENALPHWDLIKKYDIVDFDLGNKITGAGFPVYKGKGARLQRALINFFLDEATKNGYNEVIPPLLVNEDSGKGTGQLPDKDGQMYYMQADNLYLIPTAEVPITNIYRNCIIKEEDLPIKNVGYTPCFRREAGSWGAHVRGLNRLHQFDKVEIVQIVHPEKSEETLHEMVDYVKSLLQKLNLPFRTLLLCGGDTSVASSLTYDLEVYSAAQKMWLEVSSVSNFETYQANRLKLRFKKDKKSTLLHTLNGSALALPRILASILENNQTEKGIKIPEVLVPYCGFDIID